MNRVPTRYSPDHGATIAFTIMMLPFVFFCLFRCSCGEPMPVCIVFATQKENVTIFCNIFVTVFAGKLIFLFRIEYLQLDRVRWWWWTKSKGVEFFNRAIPARKDLWIQLSFHFRSSPLAFGHNGFGKLITFPKLQVIFNRSDVKPGDPKLILVTNYVVPSHVIHHGRSRRSFRSESDRWMDSIRGLRFIRESVRVSEWVAIYLSTWALHIENGIA